jgi:hypothetical protein
MGKLKDNVAGKTKQIVGEVTGDGKLAEEGKEQVKKDQIEPGARPLGTSTSRPELAISSRFFHPPDEVPSARTVCAYLEQVGPAKMRYSARSDRPKNEQQREGNVDGPSMRRRSPDALCCL